MDVDKILSAAVRFSNFITVRFLLFSVLLVFYLPASGVQEFDTKSVISSFPAIETAIDSYKNTIDALGIKDVAIYLILFVLITTLHITHYFAERIGSWVPVDIVFESMESRERVIRTKFLREISEHDTKDKFCDTSTAALSEVYQEFQEKWERPISNAKSDFNIVKFLTMIFLSSWMFGWNGAQFDFIQDRSLTILIALIVFCLLLFWNLIHLNRSAMSALLYRLDGRLEASLASTEGIEIYSKLGKTKESLRKNRNFSFDWSLPFFGSVKIVKQQISRIISQKS